MLSWVHKARARLSSASGGPFVALDLDSRKLRVVHAEPAAGLPRFKKMAAIDVPEGLDAGDPGAVGGFIGESLRRLGLRGMRVAMDVPRSKAVLKTVTLPKVDDERELPGMVRYQVEKELPFSIDEAVIDFTVEPHVDAGGNGKAAEGHSGVTVLVAAVRRSVVEYYQKVAEAADIDLGQLGLRPYADVHCLRACLKGHESELANAVLVHLTADEAEIDVLIDSSLAFSRSASMAVPHDEQGRPIVESPVDLLVVEVVRTVQSVRAAQRDMTLDHIWVAGDTGYETMLAEALGKRLKARADRLRPAESLRVRVAPEGADGYITAIGLAIGHTGSGMPLDFLHPKKPPVQRDMKKVRMTYGAIAAAAVLLLAVTAGFVNLYASSTRLKVLQARQGELTDRHRAVQKVEKRYDAVQKWLDEDKGWLDHWARLSAALPPATDAYVTSLSTQANGLSFTIKARSSAVITDMSKRLREAGYDVKLGSENNDENEYGYRYTQSVKLAIAAREAPKIADLTAAPRPPNDGSAELIRRTSTAGRAETPGAEGEPQAAASSGGAGDTAQDDNRENPDDRGRRESRGGRGDGGRRD